MTTVVGYDNKMDLSLVHAEEDLEWDEILDDLRKSFPDYRFVGAFEGECAPVGLWRRGRVPRLFIDLETRGRWTAVGFDPAGDSTFLFRDNCMIAEFRERAFNARPHNSVLLIAILAGHPTLTLSAQTYWDAAMEMAQERRSMEIL
tara:strand:+ start:298 stop:735 length:438 start_codon:yes stop_codon:yes gene_type:complete